MSNIDPTDRYGVWSDRNYYGAADVAPFPAASWHYCPAPDDRIIGAGWPSADPPRTAAELLRHHVTGAVERGEAEPVVGIPAERAECTCGANAELAELSTAERTTFPAKYHAATCPVYREARA